MTNTIYETPTVSVEIFSIEQGFAQSNLGGANQAGATVSENENHLHDL